MFWTQFHISLFQLFSGAYAGGGGVHRVHMHPPTWKKSSDQKRPKEERKFRPDMSAKENARSAQIQQNKNEKGKEKKKKRVKEKG